MQKVKFSNSRGQIILFEESSPFMLNKIDGLGDVNGDIQLQKAPFQNGSTFIGSVLKERPITMEVTIRVDTPTDLSKKRGELSSIFNPSLGEGILVYENDLGKWQISAASEHIPVFPSGKSNRGITFQRALVTLIAPDPYWMHLEYISEPLSAWIGKFEFPFEFPVEFGERANRAIIRNDGDEATPVLIEFRGPATNPSVTNETTGESIKVNRPLLEGEVLEVNTAFGNKTVEIVSPDGTRTNVFHYIDLDTQFFQLVTGENVISFASEDALVSGHVTIKYKNRYLGV